MEWPALGGGQAAAIALAVMSAVLLLVFLALWSRHARGPSVPASTPESAELGATLVHLQDELRELLADATERLDVRMRALRELLDEARVTTDELRRLAAASAVVAGSNVEEQPAPGSEIRSDRAARVASERIVTPAARSTRRAEPAAAGIRLERHAQVYSLAGAGLDASQIAAQTGMHRGEVELVLRMRRKQTSADQSNQSERRFASHSAEEAKV